MPMAGRLDGKVALITGAGSGIGAATAALFAREGAAVALSDLAKDGLDAVAARVRTAGAELVSMTGDVSRRTDTERLVADTIGRFWRIHVLRHHPAVPPPDTP